MEKKLEKTKRNLQLQHRKGFTMIELIFVIVLLGIIASILIPTLISNNTQDVLKTKATEVFKKANEIKQAYGLFVLKVGAEPTKIVGTDAATADGLVKGTTSTGGFLAISPKFSGIGIAPGFATGFTDTFDTTTATGFGATTAADTLLMLSNVSEDFCKMYNNISNGIEITTSIGTTIDTSSITKCYGASGNYNVYFLLDSK